MIFDWYRAWKLRRIVKRLRIRLHLLETSELFSKEGVDEDMDIPASFTPSMVRRELEIARIELGTLEMNRHRLPPMRLTDGVKRKKGK